MYILDLAKTQDRVEARSIVFNLLNPGDMLHIGVDPEYVFCLVLEKNIGIDNVGAIEKTVKVLNDQQVFSIPITYLDYLKQIYQC